VAVDSRATAGSYIGVCDQLPYWNLSSLTQYLASGTVKKVIEINPYLLGTMAGGAGVSVETWHPDHNLNFRPL